MIKLIKQQKAKQAEQDCLFEQKRKTMSKVSYLRAHILW